MKPKFKIGQLVKVNLNNQLKPKYLKNRRKILKVRDIYDRNFYMDTKVLARVTGIKLFQEGVYRSEVRYYDYTGYNDYSPTYLDVDNTVIVYAIKLGYLNKEIFFNENDMEIVYEDLFFNKNAKDIPYKYNYWSEHDRKELSRLSKCFDRDEKGRFV